jgi:hypothetical protein
MAAKPHLKKFRMSEIIQFLNDVIKLFQKYNPTTLLVVDELTALQAKTAALEAGFKLESGSVISDELVQLDGRRDDCLIGIKLSAEAYSHHFDAAYKTAAESILNSMAKYGSELTKLNYQAETSTISSLIDEWSKNATLTKAFTKLALVAWGTQLKTLNDQFNTRYLARVSEQGAAVHTDNLVLRDYARQAYVTLITNTEARATLNKAGLYTPLLNDLSVLIKKYNLLVDARAQEKDDEVKDKLPDVTLL